jgi:predicted ChrR family anti-sigma factor
MKHDLPDIELTERTFLYALGVLSSIEALAFEQHLAEGCSECAEDLNLFEEISAHLALMVPPVEPSAEVRDKILARIGVVKQAEPKESAPQTNASAEFLTIYAQELEWKELSDGVFVKQLHVDHQKQTVASLYKISPGIRLPMHKHLGVEECFVIEGDFHINDMVLNPGDYHRAETGSVHQSLYTEKGTLLLIISPEKPFVTLN